jgi:hypothetical protein
MKTNTTNATTTANTPATATVSGITPEVKVIDIDWPFQRQHQSKPLAKAEVEALIADLRKKVPALAFQSISDRYYFGIKVQREGKTVAQYWAKKDFPRLIIHAKAREGVEFGVDLATRTAQKPLERGSKDLEIIADEFVLTPAEALSVLKALGAKKAAPAAKPAQKPAPKGEAKPAPKGNRKPNGAKATKPAPVAAQ